MPFGCHILAPIILHLSTPLRHLEHYLLPIVAEPSGHIISARAEVKLTKLWLLSKPSDLFVTTLRQNWQFFESWKNLRKSRSSNFEVSRAHDTTFLVSVDMILRSPIV